MDFHSILFHLAQIPFIGSFFFQMSPLAHGDHVAQRGAVWGHTKPAFSLMDAGAELQWVNEIKLKIYAQHLLNNCCKTSVQAEY